MKENKRQILKYGIITYAQLNQLSYKILGILLVCLLSIVPLNVTAWANNMFWPSKNWYMQYRIDNQIMHIGVLLKDSSKNNYYCVEAGGPVETTFSGKESKADTITSRRLAYLMQTYKHVEDPLAHAAIGVLAHDYFDVNPQIWHRHRSAIIQQIPNVSKKVDSLWHESGQSVPKNAKVAYRYTNGRRKGFIDVLVQTNSDAYLSGVSYVIRLRGKAVFENQQQEIRGVSAKRVQQYAWIATGEGDVRVEIEYEVPRIEQMHATQDLMRVASNTFASGSGVNMSVQKRFEPFLSTQVRDVVNDSGSPIIDTVRIGVKQPYDEWPQDVSIEAQGWYFALQSYDLQSEFDVQVNENIDSYLDRLKKSGFEPVAYSSVKFEGAPQEIEAIAMTKPNGSHKYTASNNSEFGSWVWAIDRNKQSEAVKEYVYEDVIAPLFDVKETLVNRTKVSVSSSVREHTAIVGAELGDTITVQGYPDDHGQFLGNPQFGFRADVPNAQVRVWWAGDLSNPTSTEQFDTYRPSSVEEPVEDAHHRLIGTWDYPAVNGVIRVGGGELDAYGNPVHIVAKDPGWYVFVYEFIGDDRVMPVVSAYNDGWERTKVVLVDEPRNPSIATRAMPQNVEKHEEFRDVAYVNGFCPAESYVEFTAYKPIEVDEDPGNNEVLVVDEVPVDCTRGTATARSAKVSATSDGLVYWKAALKTSDGDVLAHHDLGVPEEIVTVETPEEPENPEEPNKPEEPEEPKLEVPPTVLVQTGTSVLIPLGTVIGAGSIGSFMRFMAKQACTPKHKRAEVYMKKRGKHRK